MSILGQSTAPAPAPTALEIATEVWTQQDIYSKSVLLPSQARGVHTMDATQSTHHALPHGEADGLHRYWITTQKQALDLLGGSDPIQIIAGAKFVSGATPFDLQIQHAYLAGFVESNATMTF